jgi:hypothetical protein
MACSLSVKTSDYPRCPVEKISHQLYATDTRCIGSDTEMVLINECGVSYQMAIVLPYRWQHPEYKHFTAVFLVKPDQVPILDVHQCFEYLPAILATLARWFSIQA